MKRGRKPGYKLPYCKLPHCSRCGDRLHNGNAYKRSNGRFIRHCKRCNTDVTIIKQWRRRAPEEIIQRICEYQHLEGLLLEALEGKA